MEFLFQFHVSETSPDIRPDPSLNRATDSVSRFDLEFIVPSVRKSIDDRHAKERIQVEALLYVLACAREVRSLVLESGP